MGETKTNKMRDINEQSGWRGLTEGGFVYGNGNSEFFNTGDWRTMTPIWRSENCKQCLLCFPVCPDSSIPVENGKRHEFDLFHCKGCAICAKVCPFGAIVMEAPGRGGGNE
jgi:pyruvate ferredoxin oxidoreductase delta subunit